MPKWFLFYTEELAKCFSSDVIVNVVYLCVLPIVSELFKLKRQVKMLTKFVNVSCITSVNNRSTFPTLLDELCGSSNVSMYEIPLQLSPLCAYCGEERNCMLLKWLN